MERPNLIFRLQVTRVQSAKLGFHTGQGLVENSSLYFLKLVVDSVVEFRSGEAEEVFFGGRKVEERLYDLNRWENGSGLE